ncbi:MAG TPA: hypothetical protein VHF69_09730 [Candidatus Synoicihabitans sp.]|nr:hypothetical protein [Candidatus Synoicihabitans sp.]
MKSNARNAAPGQNVPRDSDTADAEVSDRRHIPGADDRNVVDEDYATDQAPLSPDAKLASELHDRPPRGAGQLDRGTAGDAGRPSKEGITGKPIPRRGHVR